MPQHAHLIQSGVLESLEQIPFHNRSIVPLVRRLFAGTSAPSSIEGKHVVVHTLTDLEPGSRDYCEPHSHECDEINLILSTSSLVYDIVLGDERYEVEAPACIHIPAGLLHSANVIRGTGHFIALLDTEDYRASALGSVSVDPQGRDARKDPADPTQALTAMVNGFWLTQMVHVAARLRIADALSSGPKRVEALADEAGVHAPSLHRLLRGLASRGVFAEVRPGEYELTPMADLLRADVPGSMRGLALYSGNPLQHRYSAWGDLYRTVQTGEPAFQRIVGQSPFDYLADHPEQAREFDQAMAAYTTESVTAILTGFDFSSVGSVVDIGGGNGHLMAEILTRYPHLQGTVFDLPHIVEGARERLLSAGLDARGRCEGGNFFDAIPSGADLYLMKCILHDWSDEDALRILRVCRAALAPGQRLLLAEAVIPEGNDPSLGKLMDLNMMVIHGGRERTESEFQQLLAAAGFELTRCTHTGAGVDLVEARPV